MLRFLRCVVSRTVLRADFLYIFYEEKGREKEKKKSGREDEEALQCSQCGMSAVCINKSLL